MTKEDISSFELKSSIINKRFIWLIIVISGLPLKFSLGSTFKYPKFLCLLQLTHPGSFIIGYSYGRGGLHHGGNRWGGVGHADTEREAARRHWNGRKHLESNCFCEFLFWITPIFIWLLKHETKCQVKNI